jgi:hypothetical protein
MTNLEYCAAKSLVLAQSLSGLSAFAEEANEHQTKQVVVVDLWNRSDCCIRFNG